MTNTPKHSVSVAGIVVDDDGRVLVIQRRDNSQWEPPGGILEIDEAFEAGVRREIREETGVEVSVERLTGVYKNVNRGIVALVFLCTALSEPATSTSEAMAIEWVTENDALARMDEAFAIRISDALSKEPAVTRTHDGVTLVV